MADHPAGHQRESVPDDHCMAQPLDDDLDRIRQSTTARVPGRFGAVMAGEIAPDGYAIDNITVERWLRFTKRMACDPPDPGCQPGAGGQSRLTLEFDEHRRSPDLGIIGLPSVKIDRPEAVRSVFRLDFKDAGNVARHGLLADAFDGEE